MGVLEIMFRVHRTEGLQGVLGINIDDPDCFNSITTDDTIEVYRFAIPEFMKGFLCSNKATFLEPVQHITRPLPWSHFRRQSRVTKLVFTKSIDIQTRGSVRDENRRKGLLESLLRPKHTGLDVESWISERLQEFHLIELHLDIYDQYSNLSHAAVTWEAYRNLSTVNAFTHTLYLLLHQAQLVSEFRISMNANETLRWISWLSKLDMGKIRSWNEAIDHEVRSSDATHLSFISPLEMNTHFQRLSSKYRFPLLK